MAGTVKLIFQPGEEGHAGARILIEEGLLLREPRVDAAFAIHVDSSTPCGVIAGRPGDKDTIEMLAVLRRSYLPNLTLLFRPEGESAPAITEIVPFTREMRALDGRAAAYVCTGFACRRPVTDPRELGALLDEGMKR